MFFTNLSLAPSFRKGVRIMLQTVGLGKMKPNTVVLGYKRDWKKLLKSAKGRADVEEYVNVVHDAFELDYGVAILRIRGELDLKEFCTFEEEDWFAEEEELILPEVDASGKSYSEANVSSESLSESRARVFHVERSSLPADSEANASSESLSESSARMFHVERSSIPADCEANASSESLCENSARVFHVEKSSTPDNEADQVVDRTEENARRQAILAGEEEVILPDVDAGGKLDSEANVSSESLSESSVGVFYVERPSTPDNEADQVDDRTEENTKRQAILAEEGEVILPEVDAGGKVDSEANASSESLGENSAEVFRVERSSMPDNEADQVDDRTKENTKTQAGLEEYPVRWAESKPGTG
ncbi:hypothetical protein OS493_020737 [Desmophyllum pertusum]|uniref:SLC12A transporter C-terminal domain-containing protein n=1 Tax=Desmophyllum pertusum TaxID=174260 RepID=A0A9W9YQS3_9CNID|nr:hypothetical protein OS493_020737 [Desmophyllum pertusum]